jgi:hypothetical protein
MQFRIVVRPAPSATPLELETLAAAVSAWKESSKAEWADRLEGIAGWTRGLSVRCMLNCEGESAEQVGRALVEALPAGLAESTTVEVGRTAV